MTNRADGEPERPRAEDLVLAELEWMAQVLLDIATDGMKDDWRDRLRTQTVLSRDRARAAVADATRRRKSGPNDASRRNATRLLRAIEQASQSSPAGISAMQAAELTHLHPSTVQRHLLELLKLGRVSQHFDAQDARRRLYCLKSQGTQ